MADGKLTYDIDFNVHADNISDAIARAVAGATSSVTYNKPSTAAVDAALQNLGDRLKAGKSFYGRVARNLGFGDIEHPQHEFFQNQGVNSLADFAALATSQRYGYTPSTTQNIINSAVASALHKPKKKPDMQWKFEMESLTNDIRAAQREQSKASLAFEYSQQGRMFADAAAQASTPEAQKMLLGRAASRYASIASRTLVESGAVSPDDAAIALGTAADLSALRSGIKTQAQMAAQKDREYNLMEAQRAKKEAQEDAAWASRGYSADKKAREMEMGFRAMGKSATEAVYNVDKDPDVARWNYGASLYSAAQYAQEAGKYPAGSAGRAANIELAKESMRGITISGMAKSGMHKDELARNTTALLGLTELLRNLSNEGSGGAGGGFGKGASLIDFIGKTIAFGTEIATDVMSGRTQWLSDMQTPYQTRRDVRQEWAKKYGKIAMWGSVPTMTAAGAAVGSVIPGAGTAAGALVGAGVGLVGTVAGAVSNLWGTHNADEKKIGDSIQNRMVAMAKYRDLYGAGAEYNYAQLVENMGYASLDSVMGLTRAADMLPGAMMFGAVDERQMMALSYMPNYWRGLMEGASTSELMSLYANDIMALPKQTRQYITSLLPGVNEELRAFAQSESFGVAGALSGTMKGYDEAQYGVAPGWIAGKNFIATANSAWTNKDIAEETKAGNAPNYFANRAQWQAAMAETLGDEFVFGTSTDNSVARAWNETRRALGLREFDVGNTNGKLGDIIIQIDGNTIHQEEYSTEAFIRGQQSFVVGV